MAPTSALVHAPTPTVADDLPRWKRLDRGALHWLAAHRTPPLTAVMRAATFAGDKLTLFAVGIGLALTGRAGLELGLAMGLGSAAGGVSAQLIKRVVGRRRPSVRLEGFESIAGNPDEFSFPSGHSAASFGAVVAIAGHAGVAGHVALALVPLVPISRMYLGAHYPSDVLAGALLGTVTGALANLALHAWLAGAITG